MTDRTFIRDLRLRARIGVHENERRDRQDLVINIEFESDQAPAAKRDRFADAVDYRRMSKDIITLVEASEVHLIETLADRIATTCLDRDGVKLVRVRVEKPGALRFADSVGVEITRRRG